MTLRKKENMPSFPPGMRLDGKVFDLKATRREQAPVEDDELSVIELDIVRQARALFLN